VQAIRAVVHGTFYLSPQVVTTVVRA